MKKALLIAFLISCAAMVACQPVEKGTKQTGAMPLTEEDMAAIKAIGPALDKAAVAGDWEALVRLFTEDVMMMGPNSPAIQGRSALMELIESSGMKVSKHKVQFVEVDGYGDIAYCRCTWTETSSIEGSGPIEEEGKILGMLRKQPDGSWKIAAWSWNSDLPLPE